MILRSRAINLIGMGIQNRRVVLHLLRRHKTLSRFQLASMTKLDNSTLSKMMSSLLDQGVVIETGKQSVHRRGRKQILVEINPHLGWVVGIGVTWDFVNLVILNSAAQVIGKAQLNINKNIDRLPGLVRDYLDKWIAENGRPKGRLLGIGAGLPGFVDVMRGVIRKAEYLGIVDYPVAERLGSTFQADVIIDNDVNMAAIAEVENALLPDHTNLLVYHTNYRPSDNGMVIDGYGIGLVIDGRIYRGSHFGAGELWGPLLEPRPRPVTDDDRKLVARSDGELTDGLKQISEWIAPYLAPIVNLIDPERIILGGAMDWSNKALLAYTQEKVNEMIYPVPGRTILVSGSELPEDDVALGAALCMLDKAILPAQLW